MFFVLAVVHELNSCGVAHLYLISILNYKKQGWKNITYRLPALPAKNNNKYEDL